MARYRFLLIASIALLVTYFMAGAAMAFAPHVPDPISNGAGFSDIVRGTWRTGGAWPALVLGLYGVLAALRMRVDWLRRGKAAGWSAGALGVVGAAADLALGAGTWSGVVIAVASAALLILDAKPPQRTSPDRPGD